MSRPARRQYRLRLSTVGDCNRRRSSAIRTGTSWVQSVRPRRRPVEVDHRRRRRTVGRTARRPRLTQRSGANRATGDGARVTFPKSSPACLTRALCVAICDQTLTEQVPLSQANAPSHVEKSVGGACSWPAAMGRLNLATICFGLVDQEFHHTHNP